MHIILDIQCTLYLTFNAHYNTFYYIQRMFFSGHADAEPGPDDEPEPEPSSQSAVEMPLTTLHPSEDPNLNGSDPIAR